MANNTGYTNNKERRPMIRTERLVKAMPVGSWFTLDSLGLDFNEASMRGRIRKKIPVIKSKTIDGIFYYKLTQCDKDLILSGDTVKKKADVNDELDIKQQMHDECFEMLARIYFK